MGVTLAFCFWRINETSEWLVEHRRYIHARDDQWDPFIKSINANIFRYGEVVLKVEEHLKAQDKDYAEIKRHMESHEKSMRENGYRIGEKEK